MSSENERLRDEKSSLQKLVGTLQVKLRTQGGYENIIASNIELMRTQQAEIEQLKKSLIEQMEASSKKDNEQAEELIKLNTELNTLRVIKEELNVSFARKVFNEQ
jgi:hypothetical protein